MLSVDASGDQKYRFSAANVAILEQRGGRIDRIVKGLRGTAAKIDRSHLRIRVINEGHRA
jgi:hypothetical protein